MWILRLATSWLQNIYPDIHYQCPAHCDARFRTFSVWALSSDVRRSACDIYAFFNNVQYIFHHFTEYNSSTFRELLNDALDIDE